MGYQIDRWDVPDFKAGQTVVLDIEWSNNDGPVPLSGSWCACTFRDEYGGTEFFTVTSDEGDIVLGESGAIKITIPSSSTLLLNTGSRKTNGVFDVKVILADGSVDFPIGDGRWACRPSSTVMEPVV